MSFVRKSWVEDVEVLIVGSVAIPLGLLCGLIPVVFFGFTMVCCLGDLVFGWQGLGIVIFVSTLGVMGVIGVIVGIREAVRLIRRVNRVRIDR